MYFCTINKKDLGAWKNSPSDQIEKLNIDEYLDEDLAFKVCETTAIFNSYIKSLENKKEKDDFKSADLVFKYLMCKENKSIDEAANIIRNIKFFCDLNCILNI